MFVLLVSLCSMLLHNFYFLFSFGFFIFQFGRVCHRTSTRPDCFAESSEHCGIDICVWVLDCADFLCACVALLPFIIIIIIIMFSFIFKVASLLYVLNLCFSCFFYFFQICGRGWLSRPPDTRCSPPAGHQQLKKNMMISTLPLA